jgi:hypothetical protein
VTYSHSEAKLTEWEYATGDRNSGEGSEMKIHSITTDLGPALLAAPTHGVEAPEGWGLIFWGRCGRATFGQIILSSKAKWIADYDIRRKVAVVMWPPEMAGKAMSIDTTCVEAVCPKCGSSNYKSNGERNWKCKDCDRQWLKRL